jgi:hypothetical protein
MFIVDLDTARTGKYSDFYTKVPKVSRIVRDTRLVRVHKIADAARNNESQNVAHENTHVIKPDWLGRNVDIKI